MASTYLKRRERLFLTMKIITIYSPNAKCVTSGLMHVHTKKKKVYGDDIETLRAIALSSFHTQPF